MCMLRCLDEHVAVRKHRVVVVLAIEHPQLLLDDRHRAQALLDTRRCLAEQVPDVRAPHAQVDVRGCVPRSVDGRGRGREGGRGDAVGGRGSGGEEGQARLALEVGGLPLRHVAPQEAVVSDGPRRAPAWPRCR
jgi:hypothetical protein